MNEAEYIRRGRRLRRITEGRKLDNSLGYYVTFVK